MKLPMMVRSTIAVYLLMSVAICSAGDSAVQTVTFSVGAISEISVSGNPPVLSVDAATPGGEPNQVTDNSTTYAITTNQTRKITGSLNAPMNAGVTLKINLEAPTGGTSLGDVALSDVPADLVTSIPPVAESGKAITYTLIATTEAGAILSDANFVTLTLTAP